MTQLKYDPTKMAQLKQLIHAESRGETFEKITLENVVIGNRIMEQLPLIMEEMSTVETKSVLLVTDEAPIKRGKAMLKDLIAGLFQEKG